MTLSNCIKQGLIFCCVSLIIIFSNTFRLLAQEIEWIEVSKTNNELLFIDPNSLKYNKEGFLSVRTKHSDFNPEDQKIVNSDSYLMVIDCENRLFSKLPVNSELKQVKNLEKPINDKLIKQAIINSCAY